MQESQVPPRTSYLSAFNKMDKTAMYNAEKGFGFGLSLFSSRTLNYEHMNKENKRGWYTSDGMFYLYNGDLSHYSDGYWPTVNPIRCLVRQRRTLRDRIAIRVKFCHLLSLGRAN